MLFSYNPLKLNSLLKDFYTLTKIQVTIYDKNFNYVTSCPSGHSPICRVIHSNPHVKEKCYACDALAYKNIADKKTPYSYHCHAGLMENIAPIIWDGMLLGYFSFGQIFSYPSHEAGWKHIKQLCRSYQIDMELLKKACWEMPLIPKEHVAASSHVLYAIVSCLCLTQTISPNHSELPVQIDNYIREHFTEDIDAISIARHFHIGKTLLYKIARQNYDTGIAERIRILRIEKAKKILLEHPALSLTAVAAECGFKDYTYFITVFKHMVGIPPKAFSRTVQTIKIDPL